MFGGKSCGWMAEIDHHTDENSKVDEGLDCPGKDAGDGRDRSGELYFPTRLASPGEAVLPGRTGEIA
jgi:hypothetical protein